MLLGPTPTTDSPNRGVTGADSSAETSETVIFGDSEGAGDDSEADIVGEESTATALIKKRNVAHDPSKLSALSKEDLYQRNPHDLP